MAATLVVVAAWPAAAGPPTDQLRGHVEQILKILDDPALRQGARERERRAAIRRIAEEIFDFGEISRRSLGRHWQERSPAERQEFTQLFTDLLERSYVSKIEGYSGERITFSGETLDGELATVRTRIVSKQGVETPVDYRVFQQGPRWRAYDVSIEGVSLVANYRSQFNALIQRSSYAGLVRALRAKQDEAAARPPDRRGGRDAAPGGGPGPLPRQSP
ncbi:MAG TPA: ABC transporter substrate-binding protein [Methylomirabilota bacterium]|nr:ABC transporter substrate-binding protein [Methylomirabilota bacterium]